MSRFVVSNLLGALGSVIGGVLGFYTFKWLLGYGFYGPMIPGAFLGLGCSTLAQHPSNARGIACGIAALGLGLGAEWALRPFVADSSLSFFLTHLKDLTPVTDLMLGAGAVIAYWVGKDAGYLTSRVRKAPPAPPKDRAAPELD